MMRRALPASAMAVATAIVLTGCFSSAPSPTPPSSTSSSALTGPGRVDTFDPVGQPADNGTFQPLTVPNGMPHGVGTAVPAAWLARTGESPTMGTPIAAALPNAGLSATPTVLLSVDSVSPPVGADERAWVLANEGVAASGPLVVQQVTVRVREVANVGGDTSAWDLTAALNAVNNAGDSMPLRAYERSPYACHGESNPFAEHGLTTNDTVQVCMYALGSIASNPTVWLNGIQVLGVVDGQKEPVMIRSALQQPQSGDEE